MVASPSARERTRVVGGSVRVARELQRGQREPTQREGRAHRVDDARRAVDVDRGRGPRFERNGVRVARLFERGHVDAVGPLARRDLGAGRDRVDDPLGERGVLGVGSATGDCSAAVTSSRRRRSRRLAMTNATSARIAG